MKWALARRRAAAHSCRRASDRLAISAPTAASSDQPPPGLSRAPGRCHSPAQSAPAPPGWREGSAPGVRAFEARVDIAHNKPATIAKVEDRGRAVCTATAPCSSQQQQRPNGLACRNPPPSSALIDPAVKRRDNVLDDPHAYPGSPKAPEYGGPCTVAYRHWFFVQFGIFFIGSTLLSLYPEPTLR